MVNEIRIAGQRIDVPDGLSITLEENSPLNESGITVGDFSQGITIQLTPRNRTIFANPHLIQLAIRSNRFENVEIVDEHFGNIRGVLILKKAYEEDGNTWADFDFFTNLLGIDIYSEKLADVLTKNVNLGSTTGAIVSAANAQNSATMSADGASGAVLKFIPTWAPDFYGSKNKDWAPDTNDYRFESAYEENQVVNFRLPEFINDHNVPDGMLHAMVMRQFLATAAIAAGEDPFSTADKYEVIRTSVMNMPNGGNVQQNSSYNERLKTMNRHSLLPYLQVHDVIRAIAAAIGYTAKGAFLKDAHEQRLLMQSNLALDKTSGSPNYVFVGIPTEGYEFDTADNSVVQYIIWTQFDGAYSDEGSRMAGAWPYTPNQTQIYYQCVADGPGLIKVKLRMTNNAANTPTATIDIFEVDDPYETIEVGDLILTKSVGIGSLQVVNMMLEESISLQADHRYLVRLNISGLNANVTLNLASLEIKNHETDFVNIYENDVRYADHMPDVTVAEYLESFREWKNLYIYFDPLNRVLQLDYADSLIATQTGTIDLDEYKLVGQRVELKPKRRFSLNYGELPNTFEKLSGAEELDPVNSAFDLPPPNSGNKFIFVKNEQAYYITREYDYGGRLFWEFAGHYWPDLKIEESGALSLIKPSLGPVEMRRVAHTAGEFLCPYYDGAGRSEMYNPMGARPPIRLLYWVGMVTTNSSYAYGAVTSRNDEGTTVLTRSMQWLDQYTAFWKRTLQSIVLEEIITRSFMIPASVSQTLQWSKLIMLHHTPAILLKRLRGIGIAQHQQLEMRKLKLTEISVVDAPVIVVPELDETFLFNLMAPPLITVGLTKKVDGYTGAAAQLVNAGDGTLELEFNSGYADLAAADAFFSADADVDVFYDQLGTNHLTQDTAGNQYQKSTNDFMLGGISRLAVSGFSGDLANMKNIDPYTVVLIIDSKDTPITDVVFTPLEFTSSRGSLLMVWSGNGTTLIVRYSNPQEGYQYAGLRSSGTKLLIITSAGGSTLDRTKLNLYWNGATTPETPSAFYAGGANAEAPIIRVRASAWGGDSFFKEFDLLPYVVTTEQITTIKEYYEAKGYSFS